MALTGSLYVTSLLLKIVDLSSAFYPVATTLANTVRLLFFALIGLRIAYGIYQRVTRPKLPLDVSLRARVAHLVSQTQIRMGIKKPVKLFILRGSTNAANPGRNRVLIGEKLALRMEDQELMGIIGHELAHGVKHHVLIKSLMIPALVVFAILISLLASPAGNLTIFLWTFFSLATLAEVPVSWRLEYSADRTSAECLGSEAMIRALKSMRSFHFDGISFTHPPLSKRINRLEDTLGAHNIPWTPPPPLPSLSANQPSQTAVIPREPEVRFPQYVYGKTRPAISSCKYCGARILPGMQNCPTCNADVATM